MLETMHNIVLSKIDLEFQPDKKRYPLASTKSLRTSVPRVQRKIQPEPIKTQPRREKTAFPLEFAPLVNRWLVNTMGNTMRYIEPLEIYGCIVLTKFLPSREKDPIMPVPLIHVSGWAGWWHNWAWRELALMIIELETPNASTSRYVQLAKRRAKTIVKNSRQFMSAGEHQYYSNQIWECVANPSRRDWRDIIDRQKQLSQR